MKSARSRKSKYHGLLAEPIVAVPVSPSWNRLTTPNPTPEQLAELEEAMFAANSHNLMGIVDRVRELFEHYEITPRARKSGRSWRWRWRMSMYPVFES